MRLLPCTVLLATVLASNLMAQNESLEQETADPQIVQLNELAARGGPIHLGDALNSFARLKRWNDAQRWLIQGVAPMNDQESLAAIAGRIGTDNLFKLAMEPSINDQAKAAVRKIAKAFQDFSQAEDRLRAAIDGLDDDRVDTRIESARRLMAGGTASLEALVAAAVTDRPTAPRDEILRAMLQLGGGGEFALKQLAIYGAGSARTEALKAYTRIDRKTALPELLTAVHATDTTASESEFAKANLATIVGGVPSRTESIRYLFDQLQQARGDAELAKNDLKRHRIWTVKADRKSVQSSYALAVQKAYRDAFDAGAQLRRIGKLTSEMTNAVVASDLSYRMMIDPDWGRPDQLNSFRATYADQLGPSELSDAIANALDQRVQPALVGLLRLIDQSMADQRHLLLMNQSPSPSPLVRAAMSSDPRIRYEATLAIARLDPPASYPGSSHVTRCCAEMSRLSDRPLAILVETRANIVLHQESILRQLGFETLTVGSVADVERCVSLGGDLRLIVSKTQLWDASPIEMIDRVRRLKLGNNVPILFYGEEAAGIDTDRWKGVSSMIERPKSPAAYGNFLMDQELADRLPPLTELDRSLYRRKANELLPRK